VREPAAADEAAAVVAAVAAQLLVVQAGLEGVAVWWRSSMSAMSVMASR
jgi:hypothetical protein